VAVSSATRLMARFDRFQVNLSSGELFQSGVRVPLQDQPFQVLRLLLEAEGRVVTRDQLRSALWPEDTFVDFERGVNTAVKKVRQALEDSADKPKFVETLPKVGYRFIVPVKWVPDLIADSTPRPRPIPFPAAPASGRKVTAATAIIVCAVIAALLYPWIAPRIARLIRLYQLQQLTVVPLTSLPGSVTSPTFSPDGSQVAFAWDGENSGAGFDLYVKAIGAEKPLRITHHPSVELSAAWSPDGRNIAISRLAADADSGLYLVPPTGGSERKLLSQNSTKWFGKVVSWSPDGKYLAFILHPLDSPSDSSFGLGLLSLETLKVTPIATGCAYAMPSFSPRGDLLAWVCGSESSALLRLLHTSGGKMTQVLERRDGMNGIAWSVNGRRIVYSGPWDAGDLWEVPVDQPGQAIKLPVGHDVTDIAVSPAAYRLAYVQGASNTNIWRLDLLASPPTASKLVISSRHQSAPNISPDGSKIAFESDRSGSNEIWVSNSDGSDPVQLTSLGILATGTPRWSPDGKLIAFDSRIDGEANLYVIDPAGGAPRKLNIDIRGNSQPGWSHDGRWIYFINGDDASRPSVWKVPSQGGHAVQIAPASARLPLESPDGQYVYFARNRKLWRATTDGSSSEEVRGMPQLNFMGDEWFPSGSGIYFMSHSGYKTAIYLFDLATGRVRQVYELEKFPPGWIGGMPVSSDGKWLLFPQVDESSSNLMLIENWR